MSGSRFGRVVDGVQWVVGVGAAAAVVMLFSLGGARGPTSTDDTLSDGEVAAEEVADPAVLAAGQTVFAARCATCHGLEGEGGVGPPLIDVQDRYPDPADQIAVVTLGRGTMQSFAGELTSDEIAAVVAYTRNDLG